MRGKRFSLSVALLLVVCTGAVAAGHPTGEEVVAGLKRSFSAVNDYRVQGSLSVTGPDISINNMKLTLYYKKPNKVHVDAGEGLAIIPRGTFLGNPISDLADSGKPVYVRSETCNGRLCDVVKVGGGDRPTVIWADRERHVIVATESSGFMSNKTTWDYVKVDGRYYMPSQLRAVATMPRHKNHGGETTEAVLKFSDYVVNKGISDKVFDKPRKQ